MVSKGCNQAAYGLLLSLVVALPFVHSSEAASSFILVKQLLFEPLILVVTLLWALSMVSTNGLRSVRSRLLVLVLLFLCICALSLIGAEPLHEATIELRAWLAAGLGTLLAANLVRSRARLWGLLGGLAAAGVLQAVIGIVQYSGGEFMASAISGAAGTLGNPNYLGGLLAMFWFPVVVVSIGRTRFLSIAGVLLLSAVMGAGLLFSDCQSAYIGACTGFLLLGAVLLSGKLSRRKMAAAAGLILLITLAASIPAPTSARQVSENFIGLEERATKGRILIWRATLLMVRDQPFLGTGLGTYPYYYLDYLSESLEGRDVKPIRRLIQFVHKPHNAYLQIWSETGTAGLLVFLSLLAACLIGSLKLLPRLKHSRDRHAVLGITCGLLALATTMVFSSLLVISPLREYFWLFIGLAISLPSAVGRGEEWTWSPPAAWRAPCFGLLLLVLLAGLVLSAAHSLRLYEANVHWKNGLQARDAGRLSEAVSWYSKALQLTPGRHELRFLRGSVLAKLSELAGDTETKRRYLMDGLTDLEQAARGYSDVRLYANLGKCYADIGDHERSRIWYEREAASGLNYADAHTRLGAALLALGRLEQAARELDEALSARPGLAMARFYLGMVRMNQGRHDEAGEHFRSFLAEYPDSLEGHNNLGLTLMERGELREAIESFKRALQVQPDNVWVLNNLGAAYYRSGELALARAQWTRVLEIDPGNRVARDNLSLRVDAGSSYP
jgi:tetratricopeptide (TPR) repeat protein/O-antigen ligase